MARSLLFLQHDGTTLYSHDSKLASILSHIHLPLWR